MAKEKQEDSVKAEKSVDFVKQVKEATQAQGLSSFIRVNTSDEVTAEGLKQLEDEYTPQGYEVFSNGKTVVLLKQ